VTIGSVILEKKFYKNRLPGTKDQLKGHSRNRAVGSLQFKRSAYNFKDNRNLVLVYYEEIVKRTMLLNIHGQLHQC
jgi:hypothetical protein